MKSPNIQNSVEKLLALRSIEKIIQLCGHGMKSEGWDVVIANVGHASENVLLKGQMKNSESKQHDQQVLQNGFKCLKLIINNYIQQLGQQNFLSVFDCI
jgi:hypothetical protein